MLRRLDSIFLCQNPEDKFCRVEAHIFKVPTSSCEDVQVREVMKADPGNMFYFGCRSVGTIVYTWRNLRHQLGHVITER